MFSPYDRYSTFAAYAQAIPVGIGRASWGTEVLEVDLEELIELE